jgi:hypothetical protein
MSPAIRKDRTYRRNTITLINDGPGCDWYIIVRGKDGCYRYDGYWAESSYENWRAALAEAKRGACL